MRQCFEYRGFQVDVTFALPAGGDRGLLATTITPLSDEAAKVRVTTKASNRGPSAEVFPPDSDAGGGGLMGAGFDLARIEIDQLFLLAAELQEASKAGK